MACQAQVPFQKNTNLYGRVSVDGQPLAGVWVSDGQAWSQTDSAGWYQLSGSKHQQTVFVITPSGYSATAEDGLTPQFWQPVSPDSTKLERRDFVLEKTPDASYGVIFLPDAHFCGEKNDRMLFDSLTVRAYERIVRSLSSCQRIVTINLGDISHDRYWYASDFDIRDAYQLVRESGVRAPMYSVTGNHDHDPSVCIPDSLQEDFSAQSRYRRLMGPAWYAVNIGNRHWVFMDNMLYINTPDPSCHYKGVAGKRNYDVCFTAEQLAWLKDDFSRIAPGTPVCICAHGPLFDNRGCRHPRSQVTFLDSLAAARSTKIDFFAGHVHRMETACCEDFPHITVYALPAVSGNMWESFPQSRPLGLDGCEGGLEYAVFSADGGMTLGYDTYNGVNPYFRSYDMNALGRMWSEDPDCKWILKEVGHDVDYTSPSYRNGILVNFWWQSPGDRIEVLEDGCPLKVKPAPFSVDPDGLFSHFNYRRQSYEGRHLSPSEIELAFSRMFFSQARRADSQIVVRALDADGRVIAEEKLR